MANTPKQLLMVDPDNVAETLCTGKLNVTLQGPLATLTFTHDRAKVGPQMNEGRLEIESVVRARIVTTLDNAIALRDLLTRIIVDMESKGGAPITGGGSRKPN